MPEIVLVIRTDGLTAHMEQRTARVGGAPITIGRDPSLDVAVADQRVSWTHARIWANEEGIWVRDMGSRNGTGLDGTRIEGTQAASLGSVVSVAGALHITIEAAAGPVDEDAEAWFLDDQHSGMRHPIPNGLFGLVPTDPTQPTLTLTQKGPAWWLLGGGMAIPIEPGRPFSVAGRLLVLNTTRNVDMGTIGVTVLD